MRRQNIAALVALLLITTCHADTEPVETQGLSAAPITIDPGSDTDVIEELPNADAEVPPGAPSVVPYSCNGDACCDFTCDDADPAAFCVRTADSGFFVPDWWIRDAGFESCSMKVTEFYDSSIVCSAALPVLAECGLAEPHACGYGLVCAALNIGYAQCLPVCGPRFPDGLQSTDLEEFFLQTVSSGCTVDGQSGTINTDGGSNEPVGQVIVDQEGVAIPACAQPTTVSPEIEPLPSVDDTTPVMGGNDAASIADLQNDGASPQEGHRLALARQAIGLNMAYLEVMRAGVQPADALSTVPQVWSWKEAGFTNICQTIAAGLSDEVNADNDWQNLPGYFEAGTAVIVTGQAAFAAGQQALGLMIWETMLNAPPLADAAEDPDVCLPPTFTAITTIDHVLRQMRFNGASLASTVINNSPNPDQFALINGVGDSSTFTADASWQQPEGAQDLCYVGDAANPSSDIASQLAAGLAIVSKWMQTSQFTSDEDKTVLVPRMESRARNAYTYAKAMYDRSSDGSGLDTTCSGSAARTNCIGVACDTDTSNSPCELYFNEKDPLQHLFAGAAALFALTGEAQFRADADAFILAAGDEAFMFLNFWNAMWPQGVQVLATTDQPDPAGVQITKVEYMERLKQGVNFWTGCSEDGINGGFCVRTPDGYAYPVDVPWGNIGTSAGGVCMAGIYHKMSGEAFDSPQMKSARCFMQKQLGHIVNHKCVSDRDPAEFGCNTDSVEGYSYMMGLGNHTPRNPHCRDCANPVWDLPQETNPNPNQLCGGVVSGPYIASPSNGTDRHTDQKFNFRENEAAIDYSASFICALSAYADMPKGAFDHCPPEDRTPLDGRLFNGEFTTPPFVPGATPTPPPVPGPTPCGAACERACMGAEINDRENGFACDYLFVEDDGVCVPFDGTGCEGFGDCGAGGEPACTGLELSVRDPSNACDYLYVEDDDGICVAFDGSSDPSEPPIVVEPPLGTCGGGGQPICAGDELIGRPGDPPVECDFGFVGGADGLCVPFVPPDDPSVAEPPVLEPPMATCGGGGQPICTGDDLIGRPGDPPVECDFGFVGGDGGLCVPFVAPGEPPMATCGEGGQPICTGDDLIGRPGDPPVECDFGFVGGADGLCVPFVPPGDPPVADSPVVEPPMATCGGGGQPICTGDDLEDRDPPYECDYGLIGGDDDLCVPFV